MYRRPLTQNLIQTQKKNFHAIPCALVYLGDDLRWSDIQEHKNTFVLHAVKPASLKYMSDPS